MSASHPEKLAIDRLVEENRRVLVIDDNEAIHEDIRKTIGGSVDSEDDELAAMEAELFGDERSAHVEGFELNSAWQGEQGLEMVRAARERGKPYALAFVDVRMPPGIDGVTTTARMLEIDPDINVVICSAYSDHSWEEMIESIGETDRVLILKKPFDTIELRQIAHCLRRRWQFARVASMKLDELNELVGSRTRELERANGRLMTEIGAKEDALALLAESNEKIRSLAYEDGLTGLPNRRLLNEHLEKVLARCARKQSEFAVIFVDLDNFKLINDTYGHQSADVLLKEFSSSLSDLIRTEDILAALGDEEPEILNSISLSTVSESVLSRLGGDEFVILLPEIKDRFSASKVARRILQRAEKPYLVNDTEIFLTVSIGIATYPGDGETADVLLRNADTAMYHAKQQGKAAFQYYSEAMNKASVERVTLENGLRRALDNGLLELYYQPQVGTADGRIVGAEALLRWRDETRGFIPPTTFIPIAEDAGLILPMGEWIISEACRQAMRWQHAGIPKMPISVNVSAIQFRRQDVVSVVRAALEDSRLDASLLCLEITETSLMTYKEQAQTLMGELRNMGVSIALDDFGTGYSSLSYLKLFPLNILKLDRSFVSEMLDDPTSASITEAITAMAHVLGLDVLAEGIESLDQLAFVRQLGCKRVQGFYFSGPVPADEFARLAAASMQAPLAPLDPSIEDSDTAARS